MTSKLSIAQSINAEIYGKHPEKSLMTISPDGSRMAYRHVAANIDQIIVLNMADKSIVRAVDLQGTNPFSLFFANNDIVILKTSKNAKSIMYNEVHRKSVAWSLNIKEGKMHRLLSSGQGIGKFTGDMSSIIGLSKDKKYAFMIAPTKSYEKAVFKVNLYQKRQPRLVQKGTLDTVQFFMNDQEEVIARERYNNKSNRHTLQVKRDGSWVTLYENTVEIRHTNFIALAQDQKHLVVWNSDKNKSRKGYCKFSLIDGSFSQPIFTQKKRGIASIMRDLTGVAQGVKYTSFTPSYEFFDEKLNARMRGIQNIMPDNTFAIVSYSPDWERIVLLMQGKNSAGDFLLYNKGEIEFLTSARPSIPRDSVNDVIEYSFNARDGLTIPTLLTIPKEPNSGPYPAIMMPHGGPASFDRKLFHYRAQYFASQGYLVIQPQFRGSTGFGLAHQNKGDGEWGKKMQDDLTDAVNVLAQEGKVDPERVCIVGASYGGYAALAGATFTPDIYKCAVSINGVSDIQEIMSDTKRNAGSDHWVVSYWKKKIGNGKFDDDHLYQISPVNFAHKAKIPVLLIHGERDLVVPFEQSKLMADALEKHNKQVEFVKLKKGNHYLSSEENRITAMKAIDKFVKQHI